MRGLCLAVSGSTLGELFFALIADDTLYFKVDASTRPEFEARGMGPLRPFGDAGGTMQCYQVPEDVLEDPEVFAPGLRRRSPSRAKRRAGGHLKEGPADISIMSLRIRDYIASFSVRFPFLPPAIEPWKLTTDFPHFFRAVRFLIGPVRIPGDSRHLHP